MSGGSMQYFFATLEDAAGQFNLDTPLRRALREHMLLLARALKAVEWNDSGDGDPDEEDLVRAIVAPNAPLRLAVDEAKEALADLRAELEHAKALKP